MPFCPSCGAEFRAGFSVCNTCGVDLVSSLDKPKEVTRHASEDSEDEHGEEALRLLGTFADETTATLVRRLLDDAGIPSVSIGGHAATIGNCTPWQVLVDEDYVEAAKETVASYQSPSLVTGQIEGELHRLSSDLTRLTRQRRDLSPAVHSIQQTIDKLREQLAEINPEIEE